MAQRYSTKTISHYAFGFPDVQLIPSLAGETISFSCGDGWGVMSGLSEHTPWSIFPGWNFLVCGSYFPYVWVLFPLCIFHVSVFPGLSVPCLLFLSFLVSCFFISLFSVLWFQVSGLPMLFESCFLFYFVSCFNISCLMCFLFCVLCS